MKNLRVAGLLMVCFLLGFVLVSVMSGCSENETVDQSSQRTEETGQSEPVVPAENPVADSNPGERPAEPNAQYASLFGFELDEHGNPVLQSGDWAQWGGTSYRNNTPQATGIPIDWNVGRLDRETGAWSGQKNIKWVSPVGSQTYGNL